MLNPPRTKMANGESLGALSPAWKLLPLVAVAGRRTLAGVDRLELQQEDELAVGTSLRDLRRPDRLHAGLLAPPAGGADRLRRARGRRGAEPAAPPRAPPPPPAPPGGGRPVARPSGAVDAGRARRRPRRRRTAP